MLAKTIRQTVGPKFQNFGLVRSFVSRQDARFRLKKHQLLKKYADPFALVLDCGCGDGTFTESIKSSIGSVLAIDLCKADLKEYERKIGKDKASIMIASLDALPVRDDIFNLVLLLDCLEHSDNPKANFKQVFDCLHKEGLTIMTAPNWYNRYLDVGAIGHQHFYSSLDWVRLVETAGLEPVKKTCLSFPVLDLAFLRDNLHFFGFWVAIIGKKV